MKKHLKDPLNIANTVFCIIALVFIAFNRTATSHEWEVITMMLGSIGLIGFVSTLIPILIKEKKAKKNKIDDLGSKKDDN
ncbi:MAG: hypothetical protein M0Q41_13350 [Bacteroidales bacterium]|nr:hypothetical protein [Acholeplasmataceae bacterium]MCK9449943.1 hypothetical protein [Bacteroidales bacterium]